MSLTGEFNHTLEAYLNGMEMVAVLVSGGVDSEVLLRAAIDVLGQSKVRAFTAVSQFQARRHLMRIRAFANELGVPLDEVSVDPLETSSVVSNPQDRCYHCKTLIYKSMGVAAYSHGMRKLADGTNLDDLDEDRPGLRAASELEIHHPLLKAGMRKRSVRFLGKALGMTDFNRPSDSCLATRVELDSPITQRKLILIEKLEQSAVDRVNGRLRARLSGKTVYYVYQRQDRDAVMTLYKELHDISDEAGFQLVLREEN